MINYFRKYQKIKKIGADETEGIESGVTYVYPKIDGTNAQLWFDGVDLFGGSRNRTLSIDNDNAEFLAEMTKDPRFIAFFRKHPDLRLYGEWLVPHSLKTYREDAWRRFYVFDVVKELEPEKGEDGDFIYLDYETYKPFLEEFNIDFIVPLGIVKNGTEENYLHYLKNNGYLIEDGKGVGEGIVVKNYNYQNKYGNIIWGKIVTNEFKEKHFRAMGAPEVEMKPIEERLVERFVTEALVEKEFSKIVHKFGVWNSKYIPMLLNTVFYCLIIEELWDALKYFKNPTINFKALQNFTYQRVKRIKKDLF